VNPLALDVPGYWRGLLAAQSGIAPITLFDTAGYKVRIGGEVKGFTPDPVVDARAAKRLDRVVQFAMVAAHEALADSGLDVA
ncbi:ketosynthase chain-length factor, partial [Escherichia coli]|nr:ketosynthase chain-length factor [Escherichia coli]